MKKKPKCFPRENSGKILAKNAQKADRSAHDLPPFLEYTICMYLIQNARARPLYIPPSSKLKYGKKGNLARQILCTYVKKLDHTVKLINCNDDLTSQSLQYCRFLRRLNLKEIDSHRDLINFWQSKKLGENEESHFFVWPIFTLRLQK